MGLIYGSVAFVFMLFAGLLGARKKVPIWRVGRAQAWMRGHLWLGFVSFPLIVFHSGFHFGVGLTKALMWLFVVVFVSGIVGAALQHFMPKLITQRIPLETIYEQIGRIRVQLLEEATTLVTEASTALQGNVSQATEQQLAASASAGTMGGLTVASGLQVDREASAELVEFFRGNCGLSFRRTDRVDLPWPVATALRQVFQQLRLLLPPNLHSYRLMTLENIS